ncbi:MAG: tetratricopeptide repeat protein [Gemmataceae bacterium]|nr:tetratricopeptide repeat protein [Gemmataceae bacterium]
MSGPAKRLLLVALGLAALGAAFFVWRGRQERLDALQLAETQQFDAAESILKKVHERDPNDVEVVTALAQGFLASGKNADAERMLARWIALRPNEVEPLKLRLKFLRVHERHAEAAADADRILALNPKDEEVRGRLPGLLFSAGRFEEAENACRQALAKTPKATSLLQLLSQIRRARGDPLEAAVILDELLKSHPRLYAALLARAILHFEADQSDKAIPLFRKVLAEDPTRQRTSRYHLSLALARVGQTEEAQRLMAEVRKMQDAEVLLADSRTAGDNHDLQARAAGALLDIGETEKAVRLLDKVLAANPKHAPSHRLLARHFKSQGLPERAAHHSRLAGDAP